MAHLEEYQISPLQEHHNSGANELQSVFIRYCVQTRIDNIVQNRKVLRADSEELGIVYKITRNRTPDSRIPIRNSKFDIGH